MRRDAVSWIALAMCLLASAANGERRPIASPTRAHRAEIRTRPVPGEALWVDGRLVHASAGVITSARWSPRGDALAAISRTQPGFLTLVVFIPAERLTFTWTVPELWERLETIDWLGSSRVGLSPKPLHPAVVVSWPPVR